MQQTASCATAYKKARISGLFYFSDLDLCCAVLAAVAVVPAVRQQVVAEQLFLVGVAWVCYVDLPFWCPPVDRPCIYV
jgi:hypothetical protein